MHFLDARRLTGPSLLFDLPGSILDVACTEEEAARLEPADVLVEQSGRGCSTGTSEDYLRIEIPGEDLPHVSHYFPGPHPYFRTRLLIVGGMNSALESALRCWRVGAAMTTTARPGRDSRSSTGPEPSKRATSWTCGGSTAPSSPPASPAGLLPHRLRLIFSLGLQADCGR